MISNNVIYSTFYQWKSEQIKARGKVLTKFQFKKGWFLKDKNTGNLVKKLVYIVS